MWKTLPLALYEGENCYEKNDEVLSFPVLYSFYFASGSGPDQGNLHALVMSGRILSRKNANDFYNLLKKQRYRSTKFPDRTSKSSFMKAIKRQSDRIFSQVLTRLLKAAPRVI